MVGAADRVSLHHTAVLQLIFVSVNPPGTAQTQRSADQHQVAPHLPLHLTSPAPFCRQPWQPAALQSLQHKSPTEHQALALLQHQSIALSNSNHVMRNNSRLFCTETTFATTNWAADGNKGLSDDTHHRSIKGETQHAASDRQPKHKHYLYRVLGHGFLCSDKPSNGLARAMKGPLPKRPC